MDYPCDPRMVDAGSSNQPTTGHHPSACQEEERFNPESGPPDLALPPRDVTLLALPRPALDSMDTLPARSHSSQKPRTSPKLRSSTSKLQPTVSRYMTIAWRLLTKVSKTVSDRRRY